MFRLARKADDDVASDGNVALDGLHPRDTLEILFARVETLHRVEHTRGPALDGKMDVVAESRVLVDCIDNVLAKIPRMRSGEAHATDPSHSSDGVEQFGEALLPCRICVGIHILSEQLDFRVAEFGHATGLGEDGIRCPAAFFAAGEWNHAVGAEFVAALDDGDVAAMWVGTRGELSFKTLVGGAIVEACNAVLAGADLNEHLGEIAVGS